MDSCSEDSMDGFMQLRSSIKAAEFYLTRGKDSQQKEVRVGEEYQADIPPYAKTNTSPQPDNTLLLWAPNQLDEDMLREYLFSACLVLGECGRDVLPLGKQGRDDELALYYLYKTGHRSTKALREIRSLHRSEGGLDPGGLFRQVESWTAGDCEKFEAGLRRYWKNFYEVQRVMLPHRRLLEVVEFYYYWKKSERYESFLHRSRRKRGLVSQGREEGESGADREPSHP